MSSDSDIPRFQKIGDIAVLNSPVSPGRAEELLKELKVRTVCVKEGPVSGKLRVPRIRALAGDGTETVHRENRCLYRLDVAKVMFSKGNVQERARPAGLVKPGEVIVDMFCGIGYFSIVIGKRRPTAKIYAFDINHVALKYLIENCKLNKIKNIKVINEDCRCAAKKMRNIADRVIMGYLFDTKSFLPSAFEFLKEKGGIIHYHFLSKGTNFEEEIKGIKHLSRKNGYTLHKILNRVIVKSYAPKTWHCVIDLEFKKFV